MVGHHQLLLEPVPGPLYTLEPARASRGADIPVESFVESNAAAATTATAVGLLSLDQDSSEFQVESFVIDWLANCTL